MRLLVNLSILLVLTKAQSIRGQIDDEFTTDNENLTELIIDGVSSPTAIDEEFTDQQKIIELEDQLKGLMGENKELRTKNLELTDRLQRQTSRHQDMILALTWQYDQLERKAQVYYNSFQTQKQNYGEIANRIVEPNNPADKQKSNLIPLLWANSMARKQQQQQTEAEIQKIEAEEYNNYVSNRPVARTYSRSSYSPGTFKKLSDSQIIGLTLKSAMTEQEDAENSSLLETGEAPGLFRFSKKKNANIRKRNLNNKNKEDVFANISFLSSGDFDKTIGGIRK